jgi:hypothetical protein
VYPPPSCPNNSTIDSACITADVKTCVSKGCKCNSGLTPSGGVCKLVETGNRKEMECSFAPGCVASNLGGTWHEVTGSCSFSPMYCHSSNNDIAVTCYKVENGVRTRDRDVSSLACGSNCPSGGKLLKDLGSLCM